MWDSNSTIFYPRASHECSSLPNELLSSSIWSHSHSLHMHMWHSGLDIYIREASNLYNVSSHGSNQISLKTVTKPWKGLSIHRLLELKLTPSWAMVGPFLDNHQTPKLIQCRQWVWCLTYRHRKTLFKGSRAALCFVRCILLFCKIYPYFPDAFHNSTVQSNMFRWNLNCFKMTAI